MNGNLNGNMTENWKKEDGHDLVRRGAADYRQVLGGGAYRCRVPQRDAGHDPVSRRGSCPSRVPLRVADRDLARRGLLCC